MCIRDSSETDYAESGARHMEALIEDCPQMELVWLKKHKIDENDYSTMFMRLNHMNIDSLILYTSSETASLQIRQLRQAGFQGAVYALSLIHI